MSDPLTKVLTKTSQSELARLLGIRVQAITGWKRLKQIPADRVLAVEEITGVPRHELRPDIYPPPVKRRTAA